MKSALKSQKLFSKFCDLKSDRFNLIVSIVERESIPYSVIELDNAKHIILFPENLVSRKEAAAFLAHYDRVSNTPGANDNSASVFYLLYHARKLKKVENHNSIIIFTDKEEIGNENSVTKQGAYSLAKYFKSKNITKLKFFVFDMCGIGSTIVLGTAGENLLKKFYGDKYQDTPLSESIKNVKKDAEETLLSVNNGEFFYITPLFSDDLGLILNGYPAILISLLPYNEVIKYKENPNELPDSWKCNHSLDDSVETLDPKSWEVLSPLLDKLSGIGREIHVIDDIKMDFYCYNQNFLEVKKPFYVPEEYNFHIIEEAFKIPKIRCDKQELMEDFTLLLSKVRDSALGYILNKSKRKSTDPSQSIYHYVKDMVELEFPRFPRAYRDVVYKYTKYKDLEDLHNIAYKNIITQLDRSYIMLSEILEYKSKVELKISERDDHFALKIISENDIIGNIKLIKDEYGIKVISGHFIPTEILRFDPANMIKGLRTLLIKWVKLNNNYSLKINKNRSMWIGCDQIFRLLKMELEHRMTNPEEEDLVLVWKR